MIVGLNCGVATLLSVVIAPRGVQFSEHVAVNHQPEQWQFRMSTLRSHRSEPPAQRQQADQEFGAAMVGGKTIGETQGQRKLMKRQWNEEDGF